ncbi:helix-turn-helix domain-containing protein [Streptomyces sp. NPDC001268]|uniref:helix-turn-helix domain-containing protein n=1 Tax=Streptomyces sp. NPDC001268 TaxID=3364553 RepID=UPI0036C0997D
MNRNPEAWKRLGRLLRDARERTGLTREEFAAKAGVSAKAVYNAERSDPPKRQQPPTLVPIAVAHGWKPESIGVILDGGEPIPAGEKAAPSAPTAEELAEHPDLLELMLRVHEFGRACMTLGGSLEARNDFEAAAQRLFESVPREVRARQSQYRLAAYRPHALGEGVPADDADAIFRAMEED